MKLKTIKTYQSVRFNQKDETHFDGRIPRFSGIQLDYKEDAGYVIVSMPGVESIIVFSTNIAYAVVSEEPVVVKKASKG